MAILYEDPVNRTFKLYGQKLYEAARQLRIENPRFGSEADEGYLSFDGTKLLEAKLQELTGDPNARLVRSACEEKMLLEMSAAKEQLLRDIKLSNLRRMN